MIVDAATPERAVFARDFDVCVIGTGPAGITVARSLAAQGLSVALMEAGGMEWSPESQEIYEGENDGVATFPLDGSRLRYLGGTSNHWNGLCRPLSPEDFVARPQAPMSGWPFGIEALDPYRAETDRILDTEPRHATPAPPGAGEGDPFEATTFLRSDRDDAPTRFAEKYAAELAASERIVLGLHANLVDLRLAEPRLAEVTEAVFRGYDANDPGFSVRARAFCLCAGGIETPRLLLNFRSQIPVGIGNAHDLVGRFFCDHPSLIAGEMILAEIPPPGTQFFEATPAFTEANRTLNASPRFVHRNQRPMPLGREVVRTVQCALPFAERLLDAVGVEAGRCDQGGLRAYRESRDPARFPWASLSVTIEQALDPDSRVALADDRDAFGLQRVRHDWRLGERDHRTLQTTALAFAGYAADTGIGRVRLYDWVLAEPFALPGPEDGELTSWHHMCTTRMSADARQGVVDADCRVHGTANLYIGGSSVFATSGYANPTYTIVQLALRLGDHLGGTLKS